MKLRTLKYRASAATAAQGHRLRWTGTGTSGVLVGICRWCNCSVTVDEYDDAIVGSALTTPCTHIPGPKLRRCTVDWSKHADLLASPKQSKEIAAIVGCTHSAVWQARNRLGYTGTTSRKRHVWTEEELKILKAKGPGRTAIILKHITEDRIKYQYAKIRHQ